MNKIGLLTIFACLAYVIPCIADLQIDTQQTSKQVYDLLKPNFDTVIEPYEKSNTQSFNYLGKIEKPNVANLDCYGNADASHLAWKFNDKIYISAIGCFVPEIITSKLKEVNLLHECLKTDELKYSPENRCGDLMRQYRNHLVCHLFILDHSNLSQIVSVTALHIATDRNKLKGFPRCLDRCSNHAALALSKDFPDTMLVTLSYSDSAKQDDSFLVKPLTEQYKTTLLLRWSEENGKLKIEQDDSCLGNPNSIATIAEARKKLKQCNEKSAR
jgi:hypothetical protein